MNAILYIGNRVAETQGTVTAMETHEALLRPFYTIYSPKPHPNPYIRFVWMLLAFFKHARQSDKVILSVYSTRNFYFSLVFALLCRLYKLSYITYLHGGNLPNRLKKSPIFSKLLFKYAQVNVAPSEYLRQAFQSAGYAITLIPNFIQIEQYPFRRRSRLKPRLLWVRSFAQTYHPEMTLAVFADILQHYPDAALCMVGPDKDGTRQKCETLAQKWGISQQVRFTGALTKKQWIELAAGYDLFISTTRFDNTPVSVIEAMALGLPILSTHVGGVPFLVEHGKEGLLSPSEDIRAMVQNIEYLLNTPEKASEMSWNARKKAESMDWNRVCPQWLEILKNNHRQRR